MNIVEQIQQLPNHIFDADENYKELNDALNEYHRLIKDGILIPRGNNVQDIYTVYTFNSNVTL